MRLLRLHLENYINIYNGMGLKSLTIDFSKCTHKLLVIKGMNGSGKSSLFKSMSPFMDDSSVFMEDKEIKKQITYALNDGTILTITYTAMKMSNGRSKPSRCSIVRSYPDGRSFELNENSNIISGKQIIYDLFNLDDNYITLSNISATNKGLGDLTPHERKKYVGNILSAISEYTDMNKLFTSKLSILKSLIKSMNVKISQIGSVELLQSSIIKNSEELKRMEDEKDVLKTKEVKLLTKLDEYTKEGNILEIHNELVSKRNRLEAQLSRLPVEDIEKCSDEKFMEISNKMTELQTKKSILQEQINDIKEKEYNIQNKLNESEIKLNSLFDANILEDVNSRITKLENNLKFYKGCFNKIGFSEYTTITEDEYLSAIDSIEFFNNTLDTIHQSYSISTIDKGSEFIGKNYSPIDFGTLKNQLDQKLNSLKDSLKEDNILVSRSSSFSEIPKECNASDKCPFVKGIIEANNTKLSDTKRNKLIEEIDKTNKDITDCINSINEQDQLISYLNIIKLLFASINPVKRILPKFIHISLDTDNIIHHIKNNIHIDLDTSKYREYTNYITSIKATQEDLSTLKDQKKEMLEASKESISIKSIIEKYKLDLVDICDSKSTLIDKIRKIDDEISLINDEYQYMNLLKAQKTEYIEYSDELKEIQDKLSKINIEEYQTIYNEVSEVSNRLNCLNHNDIPLIQSDIEKAKYQVLLYDQYQQELKEWNDKFGYLSDLKRHSGINGIQTIYMSVFMNSILTEANSLLSNLFKGRFKLQPFIINENEFILPCVDDNGNVRPDISYMSDSQLSEISMILSFVLLHKASKLYNIIKLDEVDDNLDNENRLQFSILINKIMDMLEFDQCIIISHNDEIDLSNSDLIITRIEDESYRNYLLSSGANIIADFSSI